jgi:hypothetical protein
MESVLRGSKSYAEDEAHTIYRGAALGARIDLLSGVPDLSATFGIVRKHGRWGQDVSPLGHAASAHPTRAAFASGTVLFFVAQDSLLD